MAGKCGLESLTAEIAAINECHENKTLRKHLQCEICSLIPTTVQTAFLTATLKGGRHGLEGECRVVILQVIV